MERNEAIEALKTRRSCRAFQPCQVSREALEEILACGLNAPSGKNRQDTKLVVVQDPQTIRELSALNARVLKSGADPFYGAPTVCLILAPKDNSNNVKDGSAVLGAMQTAAWALGVGSCWINRCTEMLELEEGKRYLRKWGLEEYMGIGCCILGYSAQEPTPKAIRPGRVLWDDACV